MYIHILCIHSSVDAHLFYFHLLAIMNNATMKICVEIGFQKNSPFWKIFAFFFYCLIHSHFLFLIYLDLCLQFIFFFISQAVFYYFNSP